MCDLSFKCNSNLKKKFLRHIYNFFASQVSNSFFLSHTWLAKMIYKQSTLMKILRKKRHIFIKLSKCNDCKITHNVAYIASKVSVYETLNIVIKFEKKIKDVLNE